jgi:hypothetical protein
MVAILFSSSITMLIPDDPGLDGYLIKIRVVYFLLSVLKFGMPVLMVTEYATPRSIPFLESIPRVLTSGFWAIDHCYGTSTKVHGK